MALAQLCTGASAKCAALEGLRCSKQPCLHPSNRAVLYAITPHCPLPHHQTSMSVLRACTTAASSASTPLGPTPASATQASVPLIRLPAGAWVSTCSAQPPAAAGCCQAALAAEMLRAAQLCSQP